MIGEVQVGSLVVFPHSSTQLQVAGIRPEPAPEIRNQISVSLVFQRLFLSFWSIRIARNLTQELSEVPGVTNPAQLVFGISSFPKH